MLSLFSLPHPSPLLSLLYLSPSPTLFTTPTHRFYEKIPFLFLDTNARQIFFVRPPKDSRLYYKTKSNKHNTTHENKACFTIDNSAPGWPTVLDSMYLPK
eukprot:m.154714 g.154714  ORF g.154714 m.154714 type:complete len:100 (-) comp30904_c0_seq1:2189-2488(-)